jgi:hypothetical protein
MNTKKFQQYLSEPNVLEKFRNNIDIEAIRATFFKQYSFGSVKSLNFICDFALNPIEIYSKRF